MHTDPTASFMEPTDLPDERGHFGSFGGMYVPETLMTPLFELTEAYRAAQKDPEFKKELAFHLREFAGRPTHLYFAERLSEHCGGAKIYLKREDLLHTGAHKINNALHVFFDCGFFLSSKLQTGKVCNMIYDFICYFHQYKCTKFKN